MEMWLLTLTGASLVVAAMSTVSAWRLARDHRERSAARVETLKSLALDEGTAGMFASARESAAPTRRWIALVGVAAVMALVAGTMLAVHEERPAPGGQTVEYPLDLLLLGQTTSAGGQFIVSGEVRNSPRGGLLKGLAARVDLFDQNGQHVAGEKAMVDVADLRAGDGSSFVVALPKTAGVARYRLRFQLADGSPVPHVDRREADAAADRERNEHAHAN